MRNKFFKRVMSLVLVVVMAVSVMAISVVSTSALSYKYMVIVTTSDKLCAGTDADVYIYAYNAEGKQIGSRIKIETDEDDFERDTEMGVTIYVSEKIDSIKVATFEHGDSLMDNMANTGNDWHLDNVLLVQSNGDGMGDSKRFVFEQWIKPGTYAYTTNNLTINSRIDEVENLYSPNKVYEFNILA